MLPSSSCPHSPEVLRYQRQGRAVLGKQQFSTFATRARRSMGNTEDKMAFTELILQQKVPNLLLTLSPARPVICVSAYAPLLSTLWELRGAFCHSRITRGHLCHGQTVGTRVTTARVRSQSPETSPPAPEQSPGVNQPRRGADDG